MVASLITKVTFMCTTCIIGVIFLLTNDISFVKIFENTIGYTIVSCLHNLPGNISTLKDFMNETIVTTGIEQVEKCMRPNYEFLLTTFRLDNFGPAIKELQKGKGNSDEATYKYGFRLKNDNSVSGDMKHLLSLVIRKNLIGQLCWIYLGTLSATIVSFKFLSASVA